MNEIEKEQKKIYDDQTKAFMKDRKANAAEKMKPLDPLKVVAGGYVSEGLIKNITRVLTGKNLRARENQEVDKMYNAEMADQHSKATKHLKRYDKLHALRKDTNESIDSVKHKVGDTVYATHPVKRYTTMTGKVTRVGKTLTTLTHKDGTTGTYPHSDVNKDYEVLHPNPYTKERDKRNESVSDFMPSKDMISSMDNLRKTADSNRKVHLNNLLKRSKKPETIAHIKSLLAKNESVDEAFKDQAGATKKSAESRAKVTADLEKTFGKKKMFKSSTARSNFNHEVETLRSNVGNEKWRNESVDEERNVTIGTTAWVKHPTDPKKRLSGKVTSVGKTHISLQHKDGTKEMYLHKDVAVASAKNESVDEAYAPGKTVYTSHMDKVLKGKVVEPDEEDKKFTIVNINGKRHSVHNDHIHSRAEHAGFMLEDVNEASSSIKDIVKQHAHVVSMIKKEAGKSNPDRMALSRMQDGHSYWKDKLDQAKKAYPNHPDLKEDVNESEFKGTPTVKTDKYSWGTMKTIHHGNSFSIPLHPEHQESISKLKDGDTHVFKDETRAKWTATRKGPTVHFAGSVGHTAVPHASLTEETKPMTFSQFTESKLTYDQFVKGRSPIPSKSDEELASHAKKKPVGPGSGKWKQMIKAEIESRKTVKEGVFDWKANKSELDWTDKKDKKTEKSAEGGTIHKARETERNAETGGKAAKKSVGRPAGAYQGSYKIDKAKRADPKNKEELSKKVMAAKAEGFAIRKDYKGAMTAAIKKRQEELWNEKK